MTSGGKLIGIVTAWKPYVHTTSSLIPFKPHEYSENCPTCLDAVRISMQRGHTQECSVEYAKTRAAGCMSSKCLCPMSLEII